MTVIFDKVSLSYGKKSIFKALTVAFSATGISFLLGENGAGKTQLLHCIHGLVIPQQGSIFVPPRAEQAYLFQSPLLLNRSVLANLYFIRGCPASPKHYFDCRLQQVIDDLSLTPLLSQSAMTLSGGQKKRLAVARFLLQKASCWLLDEPSANLDKKNNQIIEQAITEKVSQQQKVIVATHDFFHLQRLFVEGRDELLIIKNGTLAARSMTLNVDELSHYL